MMISNSSVMIMRDDATIALENLYPALLQCFVIITCGYVAGRQNLISNTEAKGLGTFVGTFSLPALIFMSLAEVDLHSVNWMFLLSVFIAKTIIFLTVIVITLLTSRPVHPGRAGLFAIFCTQSNDFAVGCPIGKDLLLLRQNSKSLKLAIRNKKDHCDDELAPAGETTGFGTWSNTSRNKWQTCKNEMWDECCLG